MKKKFVFVTRQGRAMGHNPIGYIYVEYSNVPVALADFGKAPYRITVESISDEEYRRERTADQKEADEEHGR